MDAPIKNLLLLLRPDTLVLEEEIEECGLWLTGNVSDRECGSSNGGGGDGNKPTFGSSREASVPGLRFLRSEKTPSSNFFMLTTGRPNASKRNTRARTMSVPVMW